MVRMKTEILFYVSIFFLFKGALTSSVYLFICFNFNCGWQMQRFYMKISYIGIVWEKLDGVKRLFKFCVVIQFML